MINPAINQTATALWLILAIDFYDCERVKNRERFLVRTYNDTNLSFYTSRHMFLKHYHASLISF